MKRFGPVAGVSLVIAACAVGFEFLAAWVIAQPAFNDKGGMSDAVMDFYRVHSADVHHLRDLDEPRWQYNRDPRNAIFSVVAPFGEGRSNVLIQGDSWGEQFASRLAQPILEKFAAEHGIGIVNAGTTSYAPSPMTVQIARLRTTFAMRPTHVIASIEQSDVGDELCRYASQREFDAEGRLVRVRPEPFESNETYKLELFFRKQDIFRGNDWALVKLIKAAALGIHHNVVKAPRRCPWPAVARPLVHGLSAEDRADFLAAVRRYIDTVFADQRVESLIVLSHPHRRHLPGAAEPYILNVARLLEEAIAAHPFRDRIKLLDFLDPTLGSYLTTTTVPVFQSGDPASHLTDELHAAEYLPRVLKELESQLR